MLSAAAVRCLLSPLLTASCRSASNCFLQTSSSAHQRLTWPSYPRVEPACAKKAVTILIFLPDECLLYPTSVLPTMMEADPQGLFLIILIFTIFSMVGIGYYSPLHQSEAPALSLGEQSISEGLLLPLPSPAIDATALMTAGLPDLLQSIPDRETLGATRMNRDISPLNIQLSFRPDNCDAQSLLYASFPDGRGWC